jgi:hypothetical protein
MQGHFFPDSSNPGMQCISPKAAKITDAEIVSWYRCKIFFSFILTNSIKLFPSGSCYFENIL